MPTGEGGGLAAARVVPHPPARQVGAVDAPRPGEADQVGKNAAKSVVRRCVLQEVGADPGQATEDVVLGEDGELASADAGQGKVDAPVRERADVYVQAAEGRSVARVPVRLSSVKREGYGRDTEVEAGHIGGADLRRGGAVAQACAVRQVPVPVRARSMCSSATPAAPSASDCASQPSSAWTGAGEARCWASASAVSAAWPAGWVWALTAAPLCAGRAGQRRGPGGG